MSNKTIVKKNVAKTFRVASVSSNTNSFGLTGIILMAKDGEAFEAATYNHDDFKLSKGSQVSLPIVKPDATGTTRYSWVSLTGRTFEIPRALPKAPANVLKKVF